MGFNIDHHPAFSGLKCDVLLLADVLEIFGNNCLKNYGLFPSDYWDVMPKRTKIKPELIPDPDMYIFIEKGARVGIPYSFNRYNNNKYLKSYDPKQESNHIIYLGANNSYG